MKELIIAAAIAITLPLVMEIYDRWYWTYAKKRYIKQWRERQEHCLAQGSHIQVAVYDQLICAAEDSKTLADFAKNT